VGPTSALHPEVLAVVTGLPGAADAFDLRSARAAYAEAAELLGGAPEQVAGVVDVDAGGVPARAYRPAEALDLDAAPVVCWLHGGGWVLGDLDGIDRVCRALANASGAVVLSVDYRLAPEHPHPAAVQDADAAVAWLLDGDGPSALGADPARVLVGGDSAGGNLAAVAALHRRDAVRGQLLVYPVVDGTTERPSWAEHAADPVLSAAHLRAMWRLYLDGADPASPDASPLLADLRGAPPALVAVAGHDVLRDEGLEYARALREAGVPVTLRELADVPHGVLRWGGAVTRARELVAELGGFVRRVAGDPTA
jgi:acetyl esterase